MKTVLLLSAITFGILIPYGHEYTFLIRYFLMVLLFFSFLEVKIDKEIITKQHWAILVTIILSPLVIFYIINFFDSAIAQTAFITSAAPTAIAAPVIISLKKKNVEFTMASLVMSNIAVAVLLPFILPEIINSSKNISVTEVLFPVLITFLVPLAAAQILKFALPKIWKTLVGWKDSSFYVLIANIYIATADASNYISTELSSTIGIVFVIGLISASLCLFYFGTGWLIGGKEYAHEASQSLGQKNNAFTIWIALTFMNPLAALGPVFYVLFQNIYISWELHKYSQKS
ncbi:MAG: hypothetical protein HYS25_02755 [Ignavibacteriales bacterium]|nr:hypothetical protein [Ignavibacteriales bacterium]